MIQKKTTRKPHTPPASTPDQPAAPAPDKRLKSKPVCPPSRVFPLSASALRRADWRRLNCSSLMCLKTVAWRL